MSSLIGQTINNRYRLDAMLGDGGMGTVFRAFDFNLERQVAIKLMHGHFARQSEFRRRLVQEAQTAARLDHPSIVRIYDFGDSNIGLFIAMEYVDGGSLRDHLQRLQRLNKFLPFSQSLQIGIQIAEALDYAHRRGVIHRDVKPGNIILKRLSNPDEPGEQPFRALLTDFGLVKLQEGSPMTQSGATVGTPTYMSPEQCEGMQLDGRSDLYSLGIVLYELLTNRLPFAFQSLGDAISTHRRGTRPAPISEFRADAPPLIDSLLGKALAKSPQDRFASGHEMATALRSAMVSMEGAPTRVMVRQELDILDSIEEPPEGYELEIDAPGNPPSVVPLSHSIITLGRNADNDIVLPADGVSRHHARLQATSLGWEVVDLGGVNGTWIDDHRLRADEPTPLPPGSRLRIGPYTLMLNAPTESHGLVQLLEAPTVVAAAAAALAANDDVETAVVNQDPDGGPLVMFSVQDEYAVNPGQRVDVRVEVLNRGEIDDRVRLNVQGVPARWVVEPGRFVSVPAGERVEMLVSIRPPREASTPSGRQRVRIELISQRHPDIEVAETITLNISTFMAISATLDPPELDLPGTVGVLVQNVGTAPGHFGLVARDPEDALRFEGETGRIPLAAGQAARVDLYVQERNRRWLGNAEVYPFEVGVVSRTGGQQVLTGEAYGSGVIPPWILYGLVFLCTLAFAFAAFAAVINRDRLFGPPVTPTLPLLGDVQATQTAASLAQTAIAITATASITPTVSITPTLDLTITPVTATVDPIAAATATSAAATAIALGDSDNDGLSNAQEQLIGTDPNNPDTDGDQLSDGREVLIIGTNPRNVDTDRDGFPDGQEVLVIGSNPLDPFDPVDPRTRKPTPTPTFTRPPGPPPRTPTPTQTPIIIIVTPTATTTGTATHTPVVTLTPTDTPVATLPATATNTPEPSETPTNTPPPADTATPTLTPTVTETATGTATPTETPDNQPGGLNPVVACLATAPDITGPFQAGDWPASPLATYAPPGEPGLLTELAFGRTATALYLAYQINDPSFAASDTVRLYFDTNNNGGDPDSSDRFFQVARDGTLQVWAGEGTNSDGLTWDPGYSSTNWNATVTSGPAGWIVQMRIDVAEMPGLASTFGLMSQTQYGGALATWPEGANGDVPGSWRDVDNNVCS